MARPPLAMGTHGSISVRSDAERRGVRRPRRFRDFDGVTRLVERAGRSKAAAIAALAGRGPAPHGHAGSATTAAPTPFARAAEIWLAKLDAQVAEGTRAATTADTYRQRLSSVVLPAMGQWRLRECTVAAARRVLHRSGHDPGPAVPEDGPDRRLADPARRGAARGDRRQPGPAPRPDRGGLPQAACADGAGAPPVLGVDAGDLRRTRRRRVRRPALAGAISRTS